MGAKKEGPTLQSGHINGQTAQPAQKGSTVSTGITAESNVLLIVIICIFLAVIGVIVLVFRKKKK